MNDKTTVTLSTGRDIRIRFLEQHEVYEGLLEGLPYRRLNQQQIESMLERARELNPRVAPYLIPPKETPLEGRTFSSLGSPVAIPQVACIARFHSFAPARNPDFHFSELIVVWFQEEFAFPIAPEILEHLRTLEWDRLAGDFEY